MQIFINNIPIRNHEACTSELNYANAKSWTKEQELTFSIRIGLNEFHQKTHKIFAILRSEMKRDAVDETEASEYPELLEYEAKQYPPLDFLFIDHPALFTKMCLYLGFDLLHTIVEPKPDFDGVRYTIKQLKQVSLHDGMIELSGVALELVK